MTHEKTAHRRLAAALAFLALLGGTAVFSQATGPGIRGFLRTGDLALRVGGQEVPAAEIYIADSVPAYLILSSSLPAPVLLNPRQQVVATVSIMKVVKKPDGSVDILGDAAPKPQGGFKIVQDAVTFTVDGKPASLRPRPPLLGLRKGAELKSYSPDYVRKAKGYRPDMAALAALRKEARAVKVRVYFGSWCSHCKEHVPLLLRVEDDIRGTSKIQFEYYGLPQGQDMLANPEVRRLGIKGVPTGILYLDGKEIGRIGDWNAPEKALLALLKSPAAKNAPK